MGECYQWKATRRCSRGDSCSFRHEDNQREKKAQSSSPAPRSPTQNDGRRPSTGNAGEVVHPERNVKNCARITSKEIVRSRRVIVGILPYVKVTKLNRDANSAISACSDMLRLTGNPAKIRRKVVERIERFIEEDKTFGLRISEYRANEIQVDFTEEHKIFGIGSHRSILESTLHHMKIRVHRKELPIEMCELQERSLCAPKNWEYRTQEETLQQERCASREAWDWAKHVHKLNDSDKATFYSRSEVWSLPAPSSKKPEERTFVADAGASMHICWAGKIWVQPNWRLFGHPETPQRLSQPMEKCKNMRKPQYTFTTLSSSWRCKSSKTRLLSWRRSKTTADQEWQNNPVQDGKFRACCCPRIDRFLKFENKFVLYIVAAGHVWWYLSMSSNTTKWRYPHSSIEKSRRSNKNPKNKIKNKDNSQASSNRLCDLPDWLRGVHRKSRRQRSASIKGHTRKHFSRFRFGTSNQSGIVEAQYLYSLPRRPKLRNTQENQDYEGSSQEAHWRSRTSSRKVRWFDNKRSQSLEWRRWISKKSSTRSRGTRFGNSMDSFFVQNQNFSGDGKEFTKVSRAVGKTEGHFCRQFFGICKSLWRFTLESLNVHTPSIRDKWYGWKSSTLNKRRNICCIVTIWQPQTTSWTRRNIELESVSTWRNNVLTLLLDRKKSWEMQQDQQQPQRHNWRGNHTISQRPSEVCIELPLGWEGRRRHPCESGSRLGCRPEDKVLHEWRCVGNRSVLHCSTLVCDSGNCIAFLSFIRGTGDDKRLHWSVVCETSVSVSDCETTQNCILDRQQQRQGHHWASWTRVQSKNTWRYGRCGFINL